MKNIVAAIDFTSLSDPLIGKASELARRFGAKLWLIHIAGAEPALAESSPGEPYEKKEHAQNLRWEHHKLQEYAQDLTLRGLETETILIRGSTVHALLEKAQQLEADLLVIGAHKHSHLFEKWLGSTWQDLIRQSELPLLVIPDTALQNS